VATNKAGLVSMLRVVVARIVLEMARSQFEMNFLPDVYVPCEVCHGARYNRETLEVHYKGKTIADVLDMPIEEAHNFFESVPTIATILKNVMRCWIGLRTFRTVGANTLGRGRRSA